MIVQKDFLNKLRDFGLNSYESKLWTALLSRGISTAGELSDIANVPRSRSYDVLESLEKKGFIIMKLGKPIKYLAVPPEEVVERIKKRLRYDSDKQIEVLEGLKETEILNELNTLHKKGIELVSPEDISGSFRGRDNVYNHLESMIKKAKKSIVIMSTAQGVLRKIDYLKKALIKAKQNGVSIKVCAPVTRDNLKILKEFSNVVDVRQSNFNIRFVLVDDKELVFMLNDDKEIHESYDVGVWVDTKFFTSAFREMFDRIWKDMKKIN